MVELKVTFLAALAALKLKVKVSNSITGLERPSGFQEVEAPRLQDSRRMKVVRLSALRTGQYSWYSFLLKAESNFKVYHPRCVCITREGSN